MVLDLKIIQESGLGGERNNRHERNGVFLSSDTLPVNKVSCKISCILILWPFQFCFLLPSSTSYSKQDIYALNSTSYSQSLKLRGRFVIAHLHGVKHGCRTRTESESFLLDAVIKIK